MAISVVLKLYSGVYRNIYQQFAVRRRNLSFLCGEGVQRESVQVPHIVFKYDKRSHYQQADTDVYAFVEYRL